MEVRFEASFERDLQKIRDKELLKRVRTVIEAVKQAEDLTEVRSLRKLRGYDTYYRIRLGDYRIGIEIVKDEVIFTRILRRKDIYRYFP